MVLSDEEKKLLFEWAKRHVYASNMFVSFVSSFNDKIYIDLGFHTFLDSIKVRVDRKASRFSKWLFGPYEWKEISFNEDGPWWDDIRRALPKLIEQDRLDDLARRNKRKLELNSMAEEYSK